eukprot:TRINITY_DN410_c0_g1_i1.p1 TRINITY_DN410_c0_g1~~TRINITY_DN410_c0_g1_i1.p1  ORF type:complete len:330 (-),score=56.63 TRINITY_DN410_c0_g1_i1:33-1022(-)
MGINAMDFKNKAKEAQRRQLSTPFLGILGGLSAMIAESCTFPLDNMKTRMQMNGREGCPTYRSFGDCIAQTFRSSGIPGFYKGASAALLRQLVYSSVKMWVYEHLKGLVSFDVEQVSFFRKLTAGGIAGGIGCFFGNPADVLKIRLVNDLRGTQYKGLIDAARQTAAVDGYKGFLKGFNVNVARAIVINAVELAVYDQAKMLLVRYTGANRDKTSTHFLASFISGFIGAVISSPIDVIKTRYMNQLKTENAHKSAFACAATVYREEGLRSFYRGFIPYFMRNGPWTIVFFIAYENLKYYAALSLPEKTCLLYTSPSPRDRQKSRMPSSA